MFAFHLGDTKTRLGLVVEYSQGKSTPKKVRKARQRPIMVSKSAAS